jgi:hypothetical protein
MNKLLLIYPLLLFLFFSSCGNSSNYESIANIEFKNKDQEKIKEKINYIYTLSEIREGYKHFKVFVNFIVNIEIFQKLPKNLSVKE